MQILPAKCHLFFGLIFTWLRAQNYIVSGLQEPSWGSLSSQTPLFHRGKKMRPREVQTLRKVTQELVKSQDKSQSNLAPHSPPARLATPQTANMVSPTKISVFFFLRLILMFWGFVKPAILINFSKLLISSIQGTHTQTEGLIEI